MDYEDFAMQIEFIKLDNNKYLDTFEEDLKAAGTDEAAVEKHVSNARLYINDYLFYYDPLTMKDGCHELTGFLGNYFIKSVKWASVDELKIYCTSLQEFYQCMLNHGYIEESDYQNVVDTIENEKDYWISKMIRYTPKSEAE